MKDTEQVNSHSININNKKYSFTCTDGEDHVKELENKIVETIDAVSGLEPVHVFSDYAIKMALLLADEVISEKKTKRVLLEEIEQKVTPMLEELDKALNPEQQF
ncbi:cell division protein ZapA [bacterium]|nr:cell division protein ZapA [bacterium]